MPSDAALVSVQVQLVDPPDGGCFGFVYGQALLAAAAIAEPLGGHGLVAERWLRAVEEALPGVLPHGSRRVLGVLGALVLVEHRDHAPDHLAGCVVAGLLGDGDHLDPVLLELALVQAEAMRSRKKRERLCTTMVSNGGGVRRASAISVWKTGRLSSVAEAPGSTYSMGDQVPVCLAPLPQLAQLVGDGQVLFGLAGGGDAGVEGNGHC